VTTTRGFVGRSAMILFMLGLSMVALVVQLVRVQFGPFAPVFASQAQGGLGPVEKRDADRGLIFDRNGKLLATNNYLFYLEVETRQLTDASIKDIPVVLAELLDLEELELKQQLTRMRNDANYYRIRLRQKTSEGGLIPIIIDKVAAGILEQFLQDPAGPDLTGLALVPDQERVYPAREIMGHVIGFVNQEGEGYFGVEGFYDDWLSGKPVNFQRAYIPFDAGTQADPTAGANLVLTIDVDIQMSAATALRDAIEKTKAESGEVVVMDPKTGEILAMVAVPELDPEHYEEWISVGSDDERVVAPAVAGQFEPGSTFKTLVMAVALNEGVVSPADEFMDTGEIEIGGHIIRNWDVEAYGPQNMLGCLQYSLNTCLAYVAFEKLGAARFYAGLEDFGIGSSTGIDMAGEVSGKMRVPGDPTWTESDLGTNAFGQGLSLTTMQLLTAVGAIANGGVMVQPHIVRQVVGPQGEYWPKATVLGRPISEETANVLSEMLHLALKAESSASLVPGYRLAGKTGTAQIATEYGYDPHWTIASFIGWGPLDDPQFVVFVRIDKPQISPWGSVVAAPVFKAVVERLVIHLAIPPDDFRDQFVEIQLGDE
jgi:cell division protein FtsI/penicillin-binding protein 2